MGEGGEKVADYAKMTIRMKPVTKDRMQAASIVTKLPAWRIVEQALGGYIENLTAQDRRAIESLTRELRRARQE